MALSNKDWPRFSFKFHNENFASIPSNGTSNSLKNIQVTINGTQDFTFEGWIQRKRNRSNSEYGRWIFQTMETAIGIDTNGKIVIFFLKKWYTTEDDFILQEKVWNHWALMFDSTNSGNNDSGLTLYRDGHMVPLKKWERPSNSEKNNADNMTSIRVPIALKQPFTIGWSMEGTKADSMLVHEFRLWKSAIPLEILRKWRTIVLNHQHPFQLKLMAYWCFTSGSTSICELDFSHNKHHLLLQSINFEECWLYDTPVMYEEPNAVLLRAFQNGSDSESVSCVFEMTVDSSFQAKASTKKIFLTILVNFNCIKNTSVVINKAKGMKSLALLNESLRLLSNEYVVSIYKASEIEAERLVLPFTNMDSSGKAKAIKALEQVTLLKTHGSIIAFPDILSHIVHLNHVELDSYNDKLVRDGNNSSILCYSSIISFDDHHEEIEDRSEVSLTDKAVNRVLNHPNNLAYEANMNIVLVHLNKDFSRRTQSLIGSRLFHEYFCSEADFEWVLSTLIARMNSIIFKGTEIYLDVIGGGKFELDISKHPTIYRYERTTVQKISEKISSANAVQETIRLQLGLIDQKEKICIYGQYTADTSVQDTSGCCIEWRIGYRVIENSWTYSSGVSLRLGEDYMIELQVERQIQTRQLDLRDPNKLLSFKQYAQLSADKDKFMGQRKLRDIAEHETTFKRLHVAKETLWKKRYWMFQRAMQEAGNMEINLLDKNIFHSTEEFEERFNALLSQHGSRVSSAATGSRMDRYNSSSSSTAGDTRNKPNRAKPASTVTNGSIVEGATIINKERKIQTPEEIRRKNAELKQQQEMHEKLDSTVLESEVTLKKGKPSITASIVVKNGKDRKSKDADVTGIALEIEKAQKEFESLSLRSDLIAQEIKENESRLEEILQSVRFAYTKAMGGALINSSSSPDRASSVSERIASSSSLTNYVMLNDARRNWFIRYQDFFRSMQEWKRMMRLKERFRYKCMSLTEKQEKSELLTKEKIIWNTNLQSYERNAIKRGRHINAHVFREMMYALEEEFTSLTSFQDAQNALRKCNLFNVNTLSLNPTQENNLTYIQVVFPTWKRPSNKVTSIRVDNRLSNLVHSLLYGLRNFSREGNQQPLCERTSNEEVFLWFDQEQFEQEAWPQEGKPSTSDPVEIQNPKESQIRPKQPIQKQQSSSVLSQNTSSLPFVTDNCIMTKIMAKKQKVLSDSWCVILITCNSIFAWDHYFEETLETLEYANVRNQPTTKTTVNQSKKQKAILHIQLETPLATYDEFVMNLEGMYQRNPLDLDDSMKQSMWTRWNMNYSKFRKQLENLGSSVTTLSPSTELSSTLSSDSTLYCKQCQEAKEDNARRSSSTTSSSSSLTSTKRKLSTKTDLPKYQFPCINCCWKLTQQQSPVKESYIHLPSPTKTTHHRAFTSVSTATTGIRGSIKPTIVKETDDGSIVVTYENGDKEGEPENNDFRDLKPDVLNPVIWDLVGSIGTWIDSQSVPGGFLSDSSTKRIQSTSINGSSTPNKSWFVAQWTSSCQEEADQKRVAWEKAFEEFHTERKTTIRTLFDYYLDDTKEFVQLKASAIQRHQDFVALKQEEIDELHQEMINLETVLNEKESSLAEESSIMEQEELHQLLLFTDKVMNLFDAIEEEEDDDKRMEKICSLSQLMDIHLVDFEHTKEKKKEEEKLMLLLIKECGVHVKRCSEMLLLCGKTQLSWMMDKHRMDLKKQLLCEEIAHKKQLIHDKKQEINVMHAFADQMTVFLEEILLEKQKLVLEEHAPKFVNVSMLQVDSKGLTKEKERSGDVIDQQMHMIERLQNNLKDLDEFTFEINRELVTFFKKFEVAKDFLEKLQEAKQIFMESFHVNYSMNHQVVLTAERVSQLNALMKQFCFFSVDKPFESWICLKQMEIKIIKLVEEEMLALSMKNQWQIVFLNFYRQKIETNWWKQTDLFLVKEIYQKLFTIEKEKTNTWQKLKQIQQELKENLTIQIQFQQVEYHTKIIFPLFQNQNQNDLLLKMIHQSQESCEMAKKQLDLSNQLQSQLQYQKQQQQQQQQEPPPPTPSTKSMMTTSTKVDDEQQQAEEDPWKQMQKRWFTCWQFDVNLIGLLYDLRKEKGIEMDVLVKNKIEIETKELALLTTKQMELTREWQQKYLNDLCMCFNVDKFQEKAYQILAKIVNLEKKRFQNALEIYDVKNEWLFGSSQATREDKQTKQHKKQQTHGKNIDEETMKVDEQLVQLSISRLDVIKQEKLCAFLARKLFLYQSLKHQEEIKMEWSKKDSQAYGSLLNILKERSFFLEKYMNELANELETLEQQDKHKTTACSHQNSSSSSPLFLVSSVYDFKKIFEKAKEEEFHMKKRFCERNWTIQQQIAVILRLKELIEKIQEELHHASKYLNLLKIQDEQIYHQGIHEQSYLNLDMEDQEEEEEEEEGEEEQHLTTEGINLDFVLLIFENYINTKWTRDAMTETTTLNQKITSLKESIQEKKATTTIATSEEPNEENEVIIQTFQQALLQTQFELFINRFECKKSKNVLARTEAGISFFTQKQQQVQQQQEGILKQSDRVREHRQSVEILSTINLKEYIDPLVYDQVISTQNLAQRGCSQKICQSRRLRLEYLLKRLATTFDPRDTEGKISEVLYGASLDQNDISEIHAVKSKQVIERQWYQVAMVVYAFAKLFRLVRLKQAARKRKQVANEISHQELLLAQKYASIAKTLINQEEDQRINWLLEDEELGELSPLQSMQSGATIKSSTVGTSNSSTVRKRRGNPLKHHLLQLAHRLSYEFEENEWLKGTAGRIGLGIATFQPMHSVLGPLFDTDRQVSNFATQLELYSAIMERRPPKPHGLRLISAADGIIEIQWKSLADEGIMYMAEIKEWHVDSRFDTEGFGSHENGPRRLDSSRGNASPLTFGSSSLHTSGKMTTTTMTTTKTNGSNGSTRTTMYSKSIGWEQKLCDGASTASSKTCCVFYKLKKNQMYCIRVRGAFTRTKLGPPSDPLFIQL